MKQIEERITYLKKAITTLRAWGRQADHNTELNRIISIAEYKEELEALEKIVRDNRSLFR